MWGGDTSRNSNIFTTTRKPHFLPVFLTLPVWMRELIGGFIKGILRGVRCTKSFRVLFLHRRPPSWTTLVLYSRAVFIFNEPASSLCTHEKESSTILIRYFSTIHPRLCALCRCGTEDLARTAAVLFQKGDDIKRYVYLTNRTCHKITAKFCL